MNAYTELERVIRILQCNLETNLRVQKTLSSMHEAVLTGVEGAIKTPKKPFR